MVSIFTAAVMWWAIPEALALPSTAQLEDANRRLQHEIGERQRAEAALRDANEELERRVAAAPRRLKARWLSGDTPRKHCAPVNYAGEACSRPPRLASP